MYIYMWGYERENRERMIILLSIGFCVKGNLFFRLKTINLFSEEL
jgi:hypothetical protein